MKALASLARLWRSLPPGAATGLLVTTPSDIRYLTGFTGSAGALALSRAAGRFFTVGLYRSQARQEVTGVDVSVAKSPMVAAMKWFRARQCSAVSYDSGHLTVAEHFRLKKAAGPIRLAPEPGKLRKLRSVKSREEIDLLRASQRLTGEVFEDILVLVRPGVSERDLAAEIDFRMKRRGADGPAFDTIVASGPRSALPHGRATNRKLQAGELVVFDLGVVLDGYCGDMTRTVFLGKPPARIRRLYEAVRVSLQRAHEAVRAGIPAANVDAAPRKYLERRGLARYFVHSTGHGVGLEVHEAPSIGPGSTETLRSGMVITLEPGAYVPGLGGVRIEDLVVVRPRGRENLTTVTTEMICL